MTLDQQETLFALVQHRFYGWSKAKCSGYVHGVADEGFRTQPQVEILRGAHQQGRGYAVGYIYGFLDARGSDAVKEPWTKCWDKALEFRWWENELIF